MPPDKAHELFGRYRDAFSAGYREAYSPAVAVDDIRVIEALSRAAAARRRFPSPAARKSSTTVGLKVWSLGRPMPLSERVPVLENMGFRVVDERTYHIAPRRRGRARSWLHDMMLERADGGVIDLEPARRGWRPPSWW